MKTSRESVRRTLQPAVGKVVERRWPWPMWRIRGFADIPIGPEIIRFHDVALPQYAWWAHMAWRCQWETSVISELAGTLRAGDIFFDVGSFIGAFTLLASRLVGPDGHVVAFEPDPGPRAKLESNIKANHATNITVVPCAVGAYRGAVRFLSRGDSAGHIVESGGIEVPQITLDSYCTDTGLIPTVMKVDIEGGEYAALVESQVAHTVRSLIVEIHEPALRDHGLDPAGLLASLGPHRLLEPADRGNYGVAVTPGMGSTSPMV